MLAIGRLATRFLWREWRAGEWFLVMIAIITSITALTGLHFFTDRLDRAIQQQSATLLGGDLVVSSPTVIPDAWRQQASTLGLRYAEIWTYPSMVKGKQQLQLVNINAVSNTYPLMNQQQEQPAPHTIWVEARLLASTGQVINDNIAIGDASFKMTRILPADTEALNAGWLIAPRVLMRLDDVAATKTVIRGSRVDYRLLLAGNQRSLQSFRNWITPKLIAGQQLVDIHNQRFPLKNTLGQITNYLHLLLLACLMMSGVAIAMSTKQYLKRHYAHVALWRCLGVKQTDIFYILIIQFLIIAIICGVIGSSLGYILQSGLAYLLESELALVLPPANLYPLLTGIFVSTLLLFGFAYPVINELPRTEPLSLWRNEIEAAKTQDYFYPFLSLAGIVIFIIVFIGFSLPMLFYSAAMLFSVALLYLLSNFILSGLRYLANHCDGILRQGLNQLTRQASTVSIQLTGFTLILASLLILGLVRTTLINQWQTSLPPNTPNYFVMNIAANDVRNLTDFLQRNHVTVEKIDPIVRGRLTSLNGKPILSAVPPEAQGNNALHRELNLSWMETFPSDNKVVDGEPWQKEDNGKAYVSIEKLLAGELDLKLGDELQFSIGDQSITATIRSFRTLEWSSFHPNFYVIFPPGVLEAFPSTYITSFHLRNDQTVVLNELANQFPNITVIDMASVLAQIQQIVEKATLAIQYVFLFLTVIAILIFIISLQSTRDERRQTYKLMRILGASNQYIYKLIVVEAVTLIVLVVACSVLISFLVAFQISQLMP